MHTFIVFTSNKENKDHTHTLMELGLNRPICQINDTLVNRSGNNLPLQLPFSRTVSTQWTSWCGYHLHHNVMEDSHCYMTIWWVLAWGSLPTYCICVDTNDETDTNISDRFESFDGASVTRHVNAITCHGPIDCNLSLDVLNEFEIILSQPALAWQAQPSHMHAGDDSIITPREW